jgi:TRAP transporter 4TM/12TM fusion protein
MQSQAEKSNNINQFIIKIIFIIGTLASAFHLYTAGYGAFFSMFQRNVHWMFMVTIIFLVYPTRKNAGLGLRLIDFFLIGLSLLSGSYILTNYTEIVLRLGTPTSLDIALGAITILIVLEATRRAVGLPLVIIAALSIVYAYFGYIIPGILGHRGYSLNRIISHLYLTTEGIFGLPLGVSATFIIIFIIFGAFLDKSGTSKFFIDVAFTLTGRTMGGPAKTAIISSGFIGMVSGSAVANVVTTGTITIPLMKRTGYRPFVAGAIEALASSGGQIMPPIMGAGAFIMAEVTGIPYIKIMTAALLPAVLFYFSLYQVVHYEAYKTGIKPLTDEDRPTIYAILKKEGYLFIPILLLLAILIMGRTPNMACYFAILSVALLSWVRKETRMGIKEILQAMAEGARGTIMVAAATACAGIVIGMITLTGLGLSFSSIVISLSHGHLLLALLLTMISSIILGMGIPTAAAYIIVAVLGAPALMRLGVPTIAAHMFVFYFAIISGITPPVALAAYAGAGIAKAPPMKTAIYATLFGLYKFLLPFIFVYNTGLLLLGGVKNIFIAILVSVIISFLVSVVSVGYLTRPINAMERIALILPLPLLIHPAFWMKIIGFALFIMALMLARKTRISQGAAEA